MELYLSVYIYIISIKYRGYYPTADSIIYLGKLTQFRMVVFLPADVELSEV